MRVLKFGGTSLANASKFKQVSSIILDTNKKEQTAVVLSAPTKITNYMISLVENSINSNNNEQNWEDINDIFYEIINGLRSDSFDYVAATKLVNKELYELKEHLNDINKLGKCSDKIYAIIVSSGERLSVAIMNLLLNSKGYNTFIIDPVKKFIAAEDLYLESTVDLNQSSELFKNIDFPNDVILLMPGFIAGNSDGELVLLGRNGSDYSASVLANCLLASACEIWTDVDGVYTSDPRIVNNANLLTNLSYKEAMELSFFGAKVIHPRTIEPLIKHNIPCYIRNTNNPIYLGTIINNCTEINNSVKGIVNIDNVVMFNLYGEVIKKLDIKNIVLDYSNRINLPVLLTSNIDNERNKICFCVRYDHYKLFNNLLLDNFSHLLNFSKELYVDMKFDLSTVTVIGNCVSNSEIIRNKLYDTLVSSKVEVRAISDKSTLDSISVIVDSINAKLSLKILHSVLIY